MPVYNAENSIEKTLNSVCDLPKSTYEVIVVDGSSNDTTIEKIAPFKNRIEHFVSEKDKGVYDAMNKGIILSSGEWLLFLGSDDVLHGEELLADMVTHEKSDEMLRISGVKNINADHNKTPAFYPGRWDNSLYWRNTVHHQGVLYHKEVFKTRKYELIYPVLADYHLNLRLYQEGIKARLFEGVLVHSEARGISKQYTIGLYREEWRLKKDVLKGAKKLVQPFWLVWKYLYKNLF